MSGLKPTTEHELKYDAIAKILGVEALKEMILTRISGERVDRALAAGDEYLNTIGLQVWDELALAERHPVLQPSHCPTCKQALPKTSRLFDSQWPQRQLQKTMRDLPWSRWKASQSLSDRVCVLKHVAKFYL